MGFWDVVSEPRGGCALVVVLVLLAIGCGILVFGPDWICAVVGPNVIYDVLGGW